MTELLTEFSPDDATNHWQNGDGASVRIDMSAHMHTGGGKVLARIVLKRIF